MGIADRPARRRRIGDNRIAHSPTVQSPPAKCPAGRHARRRPGTGRHLVEVCCLAAGIEQAERMLELPQRSGKAVLALALTALARHYGLLEATAAAGGRRPALGDGGLPAGNSPADGPEAPAAHRT